MEHDNWIAIFEWDEAKNRLNQENHGVSFEQVRHVFAHPDRLIFADLDHSIDEDRLLHRCDRRRGDDGAVHLSGQAYPYLRRWILAQG